MANTTWNMHDLNSGLANFAFVPDWLIFLVNCSGYIEREGGGQEEEEEEEEEED